MLAQTTVYADEFGGGFDPTDATSTLQAAIDSGADRVVVRNMGADWVVNQSILLRSEQEIFFEPGVVISAGPMLGENDILRGVRINDVVLRGYGATIRGIDTVTRHGLSMNGIENLQILGLTAEGMSYDGFYVADGAPNWPSRNVLIKDVLGQDNGRQGLSIISADHLVVVDSEFKGTSGRNPQSGIDIEPNGPTDQITNIELRDVTIRDNDGAGVTVAPQKLSAASPDVSILIDGLQVLSGTSYGVRIAGVNDGNSAGGEIRLQHSLIQNTWRTGLLIDKKSSLGTRVVIENVEVSGISQGSDPNNIPPRPIVIHSNTGLVDMPGGIDMHNVQVIDDRRRPAIATWGNISQVGLYDVHVEAFISNPIYGPIISFEGPMVDVDLDIHDGFAAPWPSDVELILESDPFNKTWELFAQVYDSDGLAAFNVDVIGRNGLTVTDSEVTIDLPPYVFNRSDGFSGIGISASQDATIPQTFRLGDGLSEPILLATGAFEGDRGFLLAQLHEGGEVNVYPTGFMPGDAVVPTHTIPYYDADAAFIAPQPLLLGDANQDGAVTGADLISVQKNFGNAGPPNQLGDADRNGFVTGADLIVVQENFGNIAVPLAVPEPASWIVLNLVGMIYMLKRRRACLGDADIPHGRMRFI